MFCTNLNMNWPQQRQLLLLLARRRGSLYCPAANNTMCSCCSCVDLTNSVFFFSQAWKMKVSRCWKSSPIYTWQTTRWVTHTATFQQRSPAQAHPHWYISGVPAGSERWPSPLMCELLLVITFSVAVPAGHSWNVTDPFGRRTREKGRTDLFVPALGWTANGIQEE